MEEARLEKELIGTNLGRIRRQNSRTQLYLSVSSTPGRTREKPLVRPTSPWNSREKPGVPGRIPWYAREHLGSYQGDFPGTPQPSLVGFFLHFILRPFFELP